MVTRHELDRFLIKGFGAIIKGLRERLDYSSDGISKANKFLLKEYITKLKAIALRFDDRVPFESQKTTTDIENLDEQFLIATNTLIQYFEKRLKNPEPISKVEFTCVALEKLLNTLKSGSQPKK